MMDNLYQSDIGAIRERSGTWRFTSWAPRCDTLTLNIIDPEEKRVPMTRDRFGYWRVEVNNVGENIQYYLSLNDSVDRPDPASQFQPHGVHRQSQTVRHDLFKWTDDTWRGIPLERMLLYELHIGTFTPGGTFAAATEQIPYLKDLGVNAIDIMPVAQFPGGRNWGYDGVHPFAVQNSYGGPDGLKRFVNEAHSKDMAIVLDVVYNHLGPEGNYLHEFGPYFTDRYKTPWGQAVNFDGPGSDGVRNYFIRNALFWFRNYHIDALRLDAIHGIFDFSAKPFLAELADAVKSLSEEFGRPLYLIAESNLNDTRVICSRDAGGLGMDAQWSDDFHHALHTILTGEGDGYYADYGSISDLSKSLSEGFVYDWRYSGFRDKRYGSSARSFPSRQFVVSTQTHDQIGNRLMGERLSTLVSFDALKVAAAAMILSPYVPMLFMGEEYGEPAPFLYFISHTDKNLAQAVHRGRIEEFASFGWKSDPPDPQAEETFCRSRLDWSLLTSEKHRTLLQFYRTLIALRKDHPAFADCSKESLTVVGNDETMTLLMTRAHGHYRAFCLFNFGSLPATLSWPEDTSTCTVLLDSAAQEWCGPGSTAEEQLRKNSGNFSLLPYTITVLETEGP